jgi:hypothetical protein
MNVQEIRRFAAENPEAIKEGQEQYKALLARSATDMEFRQKLLTDPRAAVAEFTGQPIPENFNVHFVENKGDATIVLPNPANAELSENELEAVSGGWIPLVAAVLGAFVLGATSPD